MPRHSVCLVATALLLTACGGGGDGGGTTTPPPAPTLDNVSVTPATLALSAGQSQRLAATGRTAGGSEVTGATFSFSSSAPTVASVSGNGTVLAVSAGTSTITVSGTLGSVTRSATAVVTVTGSLPTAVTVVAGTASNDFTPANVAIARGGTVTWTFGALLHNVEFQGGAGVPANVSNTSNASVSRTFNTAGNFGYVCSLHGGMNGSVFVP